MGYIDLHTHSTASDGTDSPSQLIAKAACQNLDTIALTDHDTLIGLEEAEKAARIHGINLIRGCEISTRNESGGFHILGLFVPARNTALQRLLDEASERRRNRNEKIIKKLRELGIDITLEEVAQKSSGIIGRPHIAMVLKEKGCVSNRDQAFSEFLGEGGKAYVSKYSPPPEKAVSALAEAGATAVLAHPLLKPLPYDVLENLIKNLSQHGLSALEVWHSSHSEEQSRYLKSIADKLGLGVTGGSDYHGKAKEGIDLGTGYGNLKIPGSVLDNLMNFRKARGLPC